MSNGERGDKVPSVRRIRTKSIVEQTLVMVDKVIAAAVKENAK